MGISEVGGGAVLVFIPVRKLDSQVNIIYLLGNIGMMKERPSSI